MKKLATLAAFMAITFSSQAADLYLYAGAGLKEPVEKIVNNLSKIRAIRSPWNTAVQVKFWHVTTK